MAVEESRVAGFELEDRAQRALESEVAAAAYEMLKNPHPVEAEAEIVRLAENAQVLLGQLLAEQRKCQDVMSRRKLTQ